LATDRVVEEFVCECSDGTCRQVIMLTRLEFESVRAHGARFAIAHSGTGDEEDLRHGPARVGRAIHRLLEPSLVQHPARHA
jgi:hypothetical protein